MALLNSKIFTLPRFARRVGAILFPVVLMSFGPAFSADDWNMAFHDSRHTGQTSEVVTAPLTLAWQWTDPVAYDNGSQFHPTQHYWMPIFHQGKVCIKGGKNANRVFCLDPANGATLWERDTAPGYTQNGYMLYQYDNYPAAVNGRILAASTDWSLSMDVATGNADWAGLYNTNGSSPYGGIAVWNNLGYMQFIRTDDATEAFYIVQNPATLSLSGSYYTPDNITTFADYSMRVPAVDAGVVYYGMFGQLVARDAHTGRLLWSWGTKNYNSSPAVANGIVYFYASSQSKLYALDANHVSTNGQVPVLWTASVPGAICPIVSDGTLYTVSSLGKFYAINAATGDVKWTYDAGLYNFTSSQIPAISGNTIYVPTGSGLLLALDKNTGAELWRYTNTCAFGPVVIANGMVFVSDRQMRLFAFTPQGASIGPSVIALSTSRVSNAQQAVINISGSGFFGGGASNTVQRIQLDTPSGAQLSGYTVGSDQSITGVVIPSGLPPGIHHLRVQTSIGMSVNEPPIEIVAAGSLFPATLGQTNGNVYGTQVQWQRHLARTSTGNLIAVYAGQGDSGYWQDSTYNVSHDGGLSWTVQAWVHANPSSNYVSMGAPNSSVWIDAQDHLNSSYARWTSDGQSFEKFAINSTDLLIEDAGLPVSLAPGISSATGTGASQSSGRRWVVLVVGGQVIPRYSDDGGITWTPLPAVNQTSSNLASLFLSKDQPVILYNEGNSLSWTQWNGSQWTAARTLPGPISAVQTLSAVSTNDGRLHVVYKATVGGVAYVSYSGSAWSPPQTLDAAGNSPSLTTDGTNLWCFYANSSADLVFRRTSGGAWNPPVAVTADGNYNTAPSTLALSPDAQIPVIWTAGPSTDIVVKSALIPASSGAPAVADVSAQVKVFQTAYVYNRVSKLYTSSVTLTNTTFSPIAGPVQAVIANLPAGSTLVNATGMHNGSPYLTVFPCALAPGASATVQLQITNPTGVFLGVALLTYSGSF